MKPARIFIPLLFLSACRIGFSQVYLDSSYNQVERSEAVYYQTLKDNKQGHFMQRTYLMNDTLVRLEPLIIIKGEKKLDGMLMIYYNSGRLNYSREFKAGVQNGEVKGYYENGRIRRLEQYRDGRMTDGKCYGIRGQDTAFYAYETQATFKGRDINGFREYIQRHVVYPPESVEAGNSGRVTVHFSVSTEGKIEDVQILDSPDKYLSREVQKTVTSAGQWKPATLEGKKVRQDFVIPVIFMIQ
jgi:periplasmic protein TonB